MKADIARETTSIRYLKGVGPKRALAFEKIGVRSIREFFYFFPRRYEDRSRFLPIKNLIPGQPATIRAEILDVRLKRLRGTQLLEMTVGDGAGILHAVWFNQAYLKNQFAAGRQVILFGRVEFYQNRLQLNSPEYEVVEPDEETIHTGRITPVYPLTEGLFQRSLRVTFKEALQTQLDKNISDFLPVNFRAGKNLMELREAVREMHFPESFEKFERARRRIVFDEFFIFELALLRQLAKMKQQYQAYALEGAASRVKDFRETLPFTLTASQEKALLEVAGDLETTVPMNRLLQGDVGSGKTVVAAFALLACAKGQLQGVFLVPTEILAEQHYQTLKRLFQPFNISLTLITAGTPQPVKERRIAEMKQGKISVAVGTHALLQDDVHFSRLALVVIDEQHKFGVHQRCRLLQHEPRPHQLVMTATPIPRTLALTVYGDLDVSIMKDLPQGRKPIRTYWITRKKQPEVLAHILKKIKMGEQAYFIFPVIEETEKSDLLAARREFDSLQKGIFSRVKMGLVHGRIGNEERETVMQLFRQGEIKILVATSVIEVGVDNPNATVMVVENAERFGLSQLHQMRGRIGRGEKPSECFLFGEPKTDEGRMRLRIMTKTQDGFLIAEEDLKLRGQGDIWGTRQSGDPLFRVANPILDQSTLLEAREIAKRIVFQGELEKSPQWAQTKNYLEQLTLRY